MPRIAAQGLTAWALLAVALSTTACTARVQINAVGAAPPGVSGLDVTVLEVWFATSRAASPGDATAWVKNVLPQPVTLDVAAVSPGTLLTLATQLSVPAGEYQTVYLRTADSSDALTTSASGAGLSYNTQLSAPGTNGVVVTQPLEWLVPKAGLLIDTALDVKGSLAGTTGSGAASSTSATTGAAAITSTLVLDLDASQGILNYQHGTATGALLGPRLRLLDGSLVGGISGVIDASALTPGHAPVVVSAQVMDASGTHHVVVTQRTVDAGGNFSLYPLPAVAGGPTYYDVVISCADAETTLIRAVPVSATQISGSTPLQSGALPLVPARKVFADAATLRPQLPGGTVVSFLQSVAGPGEMPYVIASGAVDPVLRRLPGDALALSAGPLQVGAYAGGATVSLVGSTPVGGEGAYLPASGGKFRLDTLGAAPIAIQGTSASATQVAVPQPALVPGSLSGTLTVRLTAPPGVYDAGFVALVSGNRLVETADVSGLLRAGGGNLAIAGIPAGSALVPTGVAGSVGTNPPLSVAGPAYQVVVRAWSVADSTGAVARAATVQDVVLGDGGSALADVALP